MTDRERDEPIQAILRPAPLIDTSQWDALSDPFDIADRIETLNAEASYLAAKLQRTADDRLPPDEWGRSSGEVSLADAREHLNDVGSWRCYACGTWHGFAEIACPSCRTSNNPLGIIGSLIVRVMEFHGSTRSDPLLNDVIYVLNYLGIPCGGFWQEPDRTHEEGR